MEKDRRVKEEETTEGSKEFAAPSDFNFICRLCTDNESHVEAVGYCINCADFLCGTCYETHCRPRPTRHHCLVDKQHLPEYYMSQKLRVCEDKCTDICQKHPRKITEFFCKTHRSLVCSSCMLADHRHCDIDDISEVSTDFNNSEEFKKSKSSLTALLDKAIMLLRSCNESVIASDQCRSEAYSTMRIFRQHINDLLDKTEEAIETESDSRLSDEIIQLQAVIKRCTDLIVNIEDISKVVSYLQKTGQNCNLFVVMKTFESNMHSIEKSLDLAERESKISKYIFKPCAQLKKSLKQPGGLGILCEPENGENISEYDCLEISGSDSDSTVVEVQIQKHPLKIFEDE